MLFVVKSLVLASKGTCEPFASERISIHRFGAEQVGSGVAARSRRECSCLLISCSGAGEGCISVDRFRRVNTYISTWTKVRGGLAHVVHRPFCSRYEGHITYSRNRCLVSVSCLIITTFPSRDTASLPPGPVMSATEVYGGLMLRRRSGMYRTVPSMLQR